MKVVSGRHMCQVLIRHGWVLIRIKGSHHAFQKAGVPGTLVVPVHGNKDLKPGTQHAIMKHAGLKESDL